MRDRFSTFHRAVGSLALELPTAVILLYHRVAAEAADPWRMCVTPAHFEQHLQVLRDIRCVPLTRLLVGDRPHRAVAISFDDGYLDNLTAASPLLAAYDLPATFFITTGDPACSFWWDRLEGISPELYQRLRTLRPGERERYLSRTHGPPRCSLEQVRELAAAPGVDIGAHSVSHPWLPGLTHEEQLREVRSSKQCLEGVLDRPLRGFAYPYGAWRGAEEAVKGAGFSWACTSQADRVWPGSNRFRLPRVVVPDLPGDRFAQFLSSWIS